MRSVVFIIMVGSLLWGCQSPYDDTDFNNSDGEGADFIQSAPAAENGKVGSDRGCVVDVIKSGNGQGTNNLNKPHFYYRDSKGGRWRVDEREFVQKVSWGDSIRVHYRMANGLFPRLEFVGVEKIGRCKGQ